MNYLSSSLRLPLLLLALLASTAISHAQTWQWANAPGAGTGSATATDAAGNVYVTGSFTGTATFGAITLTSAGGDDVFVAKLNSSGVYQWAVQGGGAEGEESRDVAVDGSGNVYVTGDFTGFSTSFGATILLNASAGSSDVFVAKLTSAGAWQWAVKAGGSGYDVGRGVVVDGSGNVYVAGYFGNATATFGATTLTSAGSADVFVAKLTPAGGWQWATRGGGTGQDYALGMAVDGSGSVAVTGYFTGSTTTFGASILLNASAGSNEVFVAKLTPAGAWQWAAKAGGSTTDIGRGVAVDGSGNVYVAGYFSSPTATFGATTLTSTGNSDAFVAKLTPAGVWQWAVKAGSSGNDESTGVAVDGSGNVYVTGDFDTSTATFGAITLTSPISGRTSVFVAKLTPAGAWQWATSGGGGDYDDSNGVAVDGSGNVSVTGDFNSPTATFGAISLTNSTGGFSFFVGRLSQAPTITSFTPTSGPTGTVVTLTGINFTGATAVRFNGVAATTFTVVSATSITATVPVSATTGLLSVTTPSGTATSATSFTVIVPPAPPTTTGASRCGPGPVTLTAAGAPAGGSYRWYPVATGGTAISGATAASYTTPSLAATTTYYGSTVSSTGTESTTRTAVIATINPLPVPTLAATPAYVALGSAISLSVTPVAGITYAWTGPGLSATTGPSVTATPTAYGTATYTLTATATATGCVSAVITRSVAVGVILTASTVTLAGPTVLVPVRAAGFTNLLGVQGSITFDPAKLTFVGVEGFGFADLDAADFGLSGAATGTLTLAWASSLTTGQTLAANAQLFALRFAPNPTAASGTAAITLAAAPLAWQAVKPDLTLLTPALINGAVTIPAGAALTGNARSATGAGISGVSLTVAGPAVARRAVTSAASTGAFAVGVVGTGAFTLTPQKSNDATVRNGVDILDLVLMQRHVLGAFLGNAYKAIAADVDRSNSVTIADVGLVRDFVLGTRTVFPKGRLWTFVRANQTFANANAPWAGAALDTARTYASVVAATAQDFVGCKLGDVNDSWNPAIPRPSGVAPDTLRVFISSGSLPVNGRLRLPLVVEAGPACGGLQGEIAWNPAELRYVGTAAARPGLVVGVSDTVAGHLPLLWTDPAGQPLRGPATLVELEFAARGPVGTLTHLDLVDGPRTPLLALDSALLPLTLLAVGGIVNIGPLGVGAAATPAAAALWPNPASETLHISGAPQAAVVVLDGPGRAVRVARLGATGTGTLAVRGLPAGVYTVRIGAAARRLVVE